MSKLMKIVSFTIVWYLIFFLIAISGLTGLQTPSQIAITSIGLILSSYLIGSITGFLLPITKKNVNETKNYNKKRKNNFEYIVKIFLFYFISHSLFIIINVFLINKIDINNYRESFFDGSRKNLIFFGGWWLFYLYYLSTLFLLALVPFFVATKKISVQVLLFIAIILYDIVFLSRTGIYYFLLATICAVIIRELKLKLIILLVAVIIILSLTISYFRGDISNIFILIKNAIINYHIAPYILLDKNIISENTIRYNGLGLASLGIYNIFLYIFDNNVMENINNLRANLNVFYDLSSNDNYIPYNAYYTSLGLIYIDFGLIGCVIISYFAGLFLSYLAIKSKKSEKYKILCVFISSLYLESLFSPITINIFSFVIVVFILLLMIHNYEYSNCSPILKKNSSSKYSN
ncbi:TPA: O-antigen polymerase [Proteus mirabilis]